MKLLFGFIPTETVWECTASMAGSFEGYVHRLHVMFPKLEHPLDSFRDYLLTYESIREAKASLTALQTRW
jgi:hypothetical protein